MKTKFTQLVVLRKKKVDEAELMLQKNAQKIIDKQAEIDALIREFATLEEPKNGVYQAFLTFVHRKNEYRETIDFKMGELALLKKQKQELQEYFKMQNVEYEKAKYLDGLEVKKILDKIRRQESKDLDEISVMLYANHHKEQS